VATIEELVRRIRLRPGCSLVPPKGLPAAMPETDDQLPDDLARFYELCGGGDLFAGSGFGFYLSDPEEVVPVDMERLGKVYNADISASWYIVARAHASGLDEVSIDLAPERLGRCYESFFDTHRMKGSCPVVATSFTDLVERLFEAEGRAFYWYEPSFESLGDAYDGYEARWVEEERNS
jgi:hypothetical protein